MQYRVPQNVDIEDKVIGPLSLRQFVFLLIGTSVILVLYFILVGPLRILFWLLALAIGVVTGIFAFVKYGDQPFETFALSALKTLTTPKQRIWKKETIIDDPVEKAIKPVGVKATSKPLSEVRGNLGRLAEVVDSGGHMEDSGGRTVSFENVPGANEAPDLLVSGERNNDTIDPMIESEGKNIPKKEPLISEAASISPDQKFDYQKIQTADNNLTESLNLPKPKR